MLDLVRRWRTVIVVTALAITLLGDALAVAGVGMSPSASRLLARVIDTTTEKATFRFAGDVRLEAFQSGSPAGPGSSIVQRLRLQGSAQVPGRARFRILDGSSVTELVVVDSHSWGRTAETSEELEEERWVVADEQPFSGDREGVVRPGSVPDPRDIGEPQDLLRLLGAVTDPRYVDVRGRRILRGTVKADGAFGSMAETIDSATVDIATTSGGRLDRLELEVNSKDLEFSGAYTFSRWGDGVDVAAPPDVAIDATPDVDEDGVAAFTEAPVLQPKVLPTGWRQTSVSVLAADEGVEGCAQVATDYASSEAEHGYLSLYQLSAKCPGLKSSAAKARPFAAGRYRGYVVVEPTSVFAQITVGSTVVQADTDLSPEDLSRVLSELVPLDTANPPPATLSITARPGQDA